ncbi:MAG: Ycf66 family protein [Synechococcus sp. SP1 MAG]|nr:Ycf66 family protein [Synechococcus sp. SP1 MAG]
MVNASLNWASIVGIVLAVGGALLYFLRTFKPALARDYDVFFAAIGLLCGGILFFQGWRLDPILQFGQFLLASTTVFFAYESVRLRGVATEQARRSAYFDDEPAPEREESGAGGLRGGWDDDNDRFDEPQPVQRRFGGRNAGMDNRPEDDFYRPRRTSRAAIPEEAASRRGRGRDQDTQDWDQPDERSRRMARFRAGEAKDEQRPGFGERRSDREDQRRGSRPTGRQDRPTGTPVRPEAEEAAFSTSRSGRNTASASAPQTKSPFLNSARERGGETTSRPISSRPRSNTPSVTAPTSQSQSNPETGRPAPRSSRPRDNSPRDNSPRSNSPRARDNSSRFDD